MSTESYKPEGLDGHAEQFWADVTESYDLRLDELIILGNACKEIQLIGEIMEAQTARSMIAQGYNGQDVADPMIQELRQHRQTLRQLLAHLKLPDEGNSRKGESPEEVSEKARMAANTRWQRVREAG